MEGGVLKLAALRIDVDRTVVTGMVASIPDPSFESYTTDSGVSTAGRKVIDWSGSLPPWTLVEQLDDRTLLSTPAIAMYWMEKRDSGGRWPSNGYSAPDGNIAMYLKGDEAAYTTVTIPVDGIYEFNFIHLHLT